MGDGEDGEASLMRAEEKVVGHTESCQPVEELGAKEGSFIEPIAPIATDQQGHSGMEVQEAGGAVT